MTDETPASISGQQSAVTSPVEYDYGVAHAMTDGPGVRSARNRTEAENDLRACHEQGSECYLVRRPVPEWERVPADPTATAATPAGNDGRSDG